MSTTVQDHVHEMARVRLRVASLVALLAAGVTAVTAVWVWNGQAEQRAILRLPEGARRALYERTLQTLQSSCKLDEGVGAAVPDHVADATPPLVDVGRDVGVTDEGVAHHVRARQCRAIVRRRAGRAL